MSSINIPPKRKPSSSSVLRAARLGCLVIALLVGLGVYLAPLEPSFLCLQFAFSEQSFSTVLSEWQPIGLARYRSHLPADFLLIALYGLFGWRFGRERTPASGISPWLAACLTWALPFAAVADVTENLLHLVITGADAPASPALYFSAGFASSIKWAGIGIFAFSSLGFAAYSRKQQDH